MNKKILVFGVHPDDAEIGMGGTIRKYVESGFDVVIADLTEGEMSSNGTPEGRREEASKAGAVLGVTKRMNLKIPDRCVQVNHENLIKIADAIRLIKPSRIYFPYSDDPHPDHVNGSRLIQEGIFQAKLVKSVSDLPPFKASGALQYAINSRTSADILIDITNEFPVKMAALRAYHSQFGRKVGVQETRLNSGFLDYIEALNRELGYLSGVGYAEGFYRTEPIRVKNLKHWEASTHGHG